MKRKTAGSVAALLFLLFLLGYVYIKKDILDSLLSLSVLILCVLVGMKVLQIIVNGLFTKITLEGFEKKISHKESAYISLISTMGNYFGPLLGGASIRAAYLKKKYNFALTHFAGTLYGYYLISFFISALIGSVGLLMLYLAHGVLSLALTLIFSGVIIGVSFLVFIRLPMDYEFSSKITSKIYRKILQMNEGWEILRRSPGLMYRLTINNLLTIILSMATIYVEFKVLHITISFPSLLLYSSLGSLSLLVSFTPGAIGIKEAIFVFSSTFLMISSSDILKVAALDRGVTMLVLVVSYIYLQFVSKLRK